MTSGTWLNIYAVWDKFPQLDAYNRYFTLKQAENGEITTEALLTTLRFKDEEDTDGRYLCILRITRYNKKGKLSDHQRKDGATLKLRAETDMESLMKVEKNHPHLNGFRRKYHDQGGRVLDRGYFGHPKRV